MRENLVVFSHYIKNGLWISPSPIFFSTKWEKITNFSHFSLFIWTKFEKRLKHLQTFWKPHRIPNEIPINTRTTSRMPPRYSLSYNNLSKNFLRFNIPTKAERFPFKKWKIDIQPKYEGMSNKQEHNHLSWSLYIRQKSIFT